MAGEAELAGRAHAFGLGFDAGEDDALAGRDHLHAVEPLEEVKLPPRAAQFSVGRELEADLLLLLDDLLDLAILDLAKLLGRDLALGALRPRLFQRGRAQQAAGGLSAS
jgi:hypothetical protein